MTSIKKSLINVEFSIPRIFRQFYLSLSYQPLFVPIYVINRLTTTIDAMKREVSVSKRSQTLNPQVQHLINMSLKDNCQD